MSTFGELQWIVVPNPLCDSADWERILLEGAILFTCNHRQAKDLRDRWRFMSKNGRDPTMYVEPEDHSFDPYYAEQVEAEAAATAAASLPLDPTERDQVTAEDLRAFASARAKPAAQQAAQQARPENVLTNRRVRFEWTPEEDLMLVLLYGTHGTGECDSETTQSCELRVPHQCADWKRILTEGWGVFRDTGRTWEDLKSHYRNLVDKKKKLSRSAAAPASAADIHDNTSIASHLPYSTFPGRAASSNAQPETLGIVSQGAISHGESRSCQGPRLYLEDHSTYGPRLQSWFAHPQYNAYVKTSYNTRHPRLARWLRSRYLYLEV